VRQLNKKGQKMNEEYFEVSDNALKVMFFEAMVSHEADPENRELYRKKLEVRNMMYDMAAKEENLSLMIMVLDGANIVDDLDLVAKAVTWINNRSDIGTHRADVMAKARGFVSGNKDHAITLAMQAGMKIVEGFEELSDLSLMVTDEPYTLKSLMH